MKTYIQAMSNHWLKVLICVLIMLRAQVHLQDNDVVNITILESAVQKGAGVIALIEQMILIFFIN